VIGASSLATKNFSSHPQDLSGPNVVRGKYPELALAAQGLIALDPDVRCAFPDADAVNRALHGLIEIAKKRAAINRKPKSSGLGERGEEQARTDRAGSSTRPTPKTR
jgi:hypothetical protein